MNRKAIIQPIQETDLQQQVFNWLAYQYPALNRRIYAIPNGGLRNKVVAAKLKREGVKPGVYDIFCSVPAGGWHGMYMEMKVGRNTLSEEQKAFKKANEQDYYFCTCYTLEAAMEEFNNYLKEYIK